MNNGFSLVELMVVVAISSILLIAVMLFFSSGFTTSRTAFEQVSATESARVQLKRITQALREARESDAGAYPLVAVEPQQLIFYADVDNDGVTERVRYELSGTQLERGIIEPSGSPIAYPSGQEATSIVASGLRNGTDPMFIYYSGDYPADETPLTDADLTEVKYVEFRLLIDTDVNEDPAPIDVVSQVQLRNLKTNLGEEIEDE